MLLSPPQPICHFARHGRCASGRSFLAQWARIPFARVTWPRGGLKSRAVDRFRALSGAAARLLWGRPLPCTLFCWRGSKRTVTAVEGPEPTSQQSNELHGQPSGWLAPSLVGREGLAKGGHGVFARRPIVEGELLAVFGGTVVSAEQLRSASPTLRRLTLQIDEDLFVVSTVEG